MPRPAPAFSGSYLWRPFSPNGSRKPSGFGRLLRLWRMPPRLPRWALVAAMTMVACGSDDLEPSTGGGGEGAGSSTTASAATAGMSTGTMSTTSSVGTGGGTPTGCKRGIAANTPPGPAFSGRAAWWYNWALDGGGQGAGIEHVPMVWGEASLGESIPSGAGFVLGFNEPNFFAQADISAVDAAGGWPQIEAGATGLGIVGPGMNFCGPADQCHDTSPYQYLKDFFAACPGCRVDYIAIHWYNCDLPSLRDYIEPGGNLEGFEQFGKPIWITEFSCDPSASVAEQQAYMEEALDYLENKAEIFRYSWFSAGPIPNARLVEDDGSPTALGQVYIDLPRSCDP